MKKDLLFIAFILFPIALSCCSSQNIPPGTEEKKEAAVSASPSGFPFKNGETVKYAIKSLGVNAGESTLSFRGLEKYKGKDAYVIVFTARAPNFFDEEQIFADAETFYPVAVVRDLNIWGKKEKITEEYDQEKGIITITKQGGGKTTTQTLNKPGPIDNIYCFIYRTRRNGKFNIGDSFSIALPTKDVVIKLVKMTNLKTAGRNFDAYYMQSDPAKYKVWFDTSEKKIPLRINGAVGINDTAMTMAEYKETAD